MNIKKIGLTALAASLVSTSSAFAGEITRLVQRQLQLKTILVY